MSVEYIGHNGVDGMCFGLSSTEKIAFLGATPVARQASTTDLKDLLVTMGLLVDSGATPLNLDGGALTSSTLAVTDITVSNDLTISDAGNVILAATTGTQIGTATTQKVAFLGATPVARQASTADLKDTMVAFGFIADSGATPLNLDAGNLTCSNVTATNIGCGNDLTITDAGNIILATTTGTQIGTATTQKLGFYGTTPAVQQTGAVAATDAATAVTAVNALRTALNNLGLTTTET